MPVYNEGNTLDKILNNILVTKWPLEIEIVATNDCSKDESLNILKAWQERLPIKILNNDTNLGKSVSVKKGILKSSGDLVVIQDADLEYEPQDLLEFIEVFEQVPVDVVYGNRFLINNKVIYPLNWLGNKGLSFLSGVFTQLRAGFFPGDMEVCYKMVKGEMFRELAKELVSTSNFGFEPEITARLSKVKGVAFKELPINYYPRTVKEGKKMKGLTDGIKAAIEILRFNIRR